MKITPIYLLGLVVLLWACNDKKATLTKIDVDRQLTDLVRSLNKGDNQAANKFCSLLHVEAYDKIVVIAPYTDASNLKLKSEGIENLGQIKDTILSMSLDDGKCVLVYIKDKKGVAYSVVSRLPVDIVGNKQGVFSFSNQQCDSFIFKRMEDGRVSLITPAIQPL